MKPLNSSFLTAEMVREMFSYDPETGYLFARLATGRGKARRFPGMRVGTARPDGRRQVNIGRNFYLEHRLIWLIVYGEWPPGQVDHRDLNRSNNAISNLRLADNSQNNANRRVRRDSLSGIKGVYFDRRKGKWLAQITHQWERRFLGYYDTAEQAMAVRKAAADAAFGEFARH